MSKSLPPKITCMREGRDFQSKSEREGEGGGRNSARKSGEGDDKKEKKRNGVPALQWN